MPPLNTEQHPGKSVSWRLGWFTTVCAALLTSGACTNSPADYQSVLNKAAGIPKVRIHCHKDVWDWTDTSNFDAHVSKPSAGMVTVTISGVNLVEYLKILDSRGHDKLDPDAVSARMYAAITPVVLVVRSEPQGGRFVPDITVEDLDVKAMRP
ncbi:hypothetical protein ACIBCO_37220 [Streptomyces violascens]|uniref:hypothetical protein n=1 Tax=Streptomyces violascens TaxID=67381 RepID=UPI0037BB8FD2